VDVVPDSLAHQGDFADVVVRFDVEQVRVLVLNPPGDSVEDRPAPRVAMEGDDLGNFDEGSR